MPDQLGDGPPSKLMELFKEEPDAPPAPPAPPLWPPNNPLDHSVVLSQVALFVGSIISICACLSVVVKYCKYRSVRRPPLSLLFWRTVCDLFFAAQFPLTLFVQLLVSRETDGNIFWGGQHITTGNGYAGILQIIFGKCAFLYPKHVG